MGTMPESRSRLSTVFSDGVISTSILLVVTETPCRTQEAWRKWEEQPFGCRRERLCFESALHDDLHPAHIDELERERLRARCIQQGGAILVREPQQTLTLPQFRPRQLAPQQCGHEIADGFTECFRVSDHPCGVA